MARSRPFMRRLLATGGALTGAAVGLGAATVAWSRFLVDHDVPLPDAIDAPRRRMTTSGAGEVSYYLDDSAPGRPLVLLHGFHAAASAFEMRTLFEAFRATRPVVAVDLPGFGFSERSERAYGPELYQSALTALLGRFAVPGGADVVALSVSAEHAALVAADNPELIRSLVMISPTGFASPGREPRIELLAREGRTTPTGAVDRSALLAQTTYDLLTTRRSLRFFLQRTLLREVEDEVVEHAWRTAHQPGARHAALAFLRGEPFVPDLDSVFDRVRVPTLVLYDEDAYSDYGSLPSFILQHPMWAAQRVPGTCGLPHLDAPDPTARAIAHWFEAMERFRPLRMA